MSRHLTSFVLYMALRKSRWQYTTLLNSLSYPGYLTRSWAPLKVDLPVALPLKIIPYPVRTPFETSACPNQLKKLSSNSPKFIIESLFNMSSPISPPKLLSLRRSSKELPPRSGRSNSLVEGPAAPSMPALPALDELKFIIISSPAWLG